MDHVSISLALMNFIIGIWMLTELQYPYHGIVARVFFAVGGTLNIVMGGLYVYVMIFGKVG